MQSKKLSCSLIILTLIVSIFISVLTCCVNAAPDPVLTLSKNSGKVGDAVSVNGTIDTENGNYVIYFSNEVYNETVASGKAEGNNVETEFTVPNLPAGQYTVTLVDVNTTSSFSVQFTIETAYILNVHTPEKPYQFMEGDNVTIFLTIKGGEASETYSLNLSVTFQNETSFKMVEVETNGTGYGTESMVYPVEFRGELGTKYSGVYTVKLNGALAEANFTIGITDKTEYHRGDTIKIRAVGYAPNENATLTIEFPGEESVTFNVTADPSGSIYYNWTVPAGASMGFYSIWINDTKKYPDTQVFAVPGVSVNLKTLNLNNKPVPNVSLEIFENGTSLHNCTSFEDGEVSIKLEKGGYTWKATFNGRFVGGGNFATMGVENETITLQVSLATLNVFVRNEKTGEGVPFAKITVLCNYTTVDNQNRSLKLTGETALNGTVNFENVFVNETYLIKTYKYNAMFNEILIDNLPEQAVYTAVIVYPSKTLKLRVLNHAGNPVQGLVVRAYERTSGTAEAIDEDVSDQNGTVALDLTFGWYKLIIFKPADSNEILVDEIEADLTSRNETIMMEFQCNLLGLDVTVKVVDVFGNALSNLKVRLARVSGDFSLEKTGNGVFQFEDIVGGEYQITVFLSGSELPYIKETVHLADSGVMVTLKDSAHVAAFGSLIDVYTFATIIAIIILLAAFAVTIVYKRLARKWIGKEKL